MNLAQLGTLAVFLGTITFVVYLVLSVAPRMAHSRLLVELSKIRSVLRDMGHEEPVMLDHPDVQRLDDLLARTIRHGHSPGMSALLGAGATVLRDRRAGRKPPVAPTFNGLTASQRVALYLLMHRASLEVVRASVFGSRLWFLAWPAWLLVAASVRQAETLPPWGHPNGLPPVSVTRRFTYVALMAGGLGSVRRPDAAGRLAA